MVFSGALHGVSYVNTESFVDIIIRYTLSPYCNFACILPPLESSKWFRNFTLFKTACTAIYLIWNLHFQIFGLSGSVDYTFPEVIIYSWQECEHWLDKSIIQFLGSVYSDVNYKNNEMTLRKRKNITLV